MKKTMPIAILLSILFSATAHGEKVKVLTEIMKPLSLTISDNYLYVREDITVHIYEKESLKYLKKFGTDGEGPKEFKGFVAIMPQQDNLLINSLGKISYWTFTGEFIREIKSPGGIANNLFWPVKDGYAGLSSTVEDNTLYTVINLYGRELKKIKEIWRFAAANQIQTKQEFTWPPLQPSYQTAHNRVYISGKPGFIIDVFSGSGDPLFTIENKDYKKRPFTAEDQRIHTEYMKERFSQQYQILKNFLKFESHFPEIANVFIDRDKIYALTWKFKDDKFELFEYDLDGKFIRTFLATIRLQDVLAPYPMGIRHGRLYQLIENEDEDWELHITNLDQ